MSDFLEQYKSFLEGLKTSKEPLAKMRPGSEEIILQTALPKNQIVSSVLAALLALSSLYTFITQVLLALSLLPSLPAVTLFLLAKEGFGAFITLVPAFKILKGLKKKGEPTYYEIITPKFIAENVPEKYRNTVRAMVFILCSLSNLRFSLILAISVKFRVESPLNGFGNQVCRIGNLVVAAISLVIDTKSKNPTISILYFSSIFVSLFVSIVSSVKETKNHLSIADFLLDLQEGEIDHNALMAILQGIYHIEYGEKSKFFIKNVIGFLKTGKATETPVVKIGAQVEKPEKSEQPPAEKKKLSGFLPQLKDDDGIPIFEDGLKSIVDIVTSKGVNSNSSDEEN